MTGRNAFAVLMGAARRRGPDGTPAWNELRPQVTPRSAACGAGTQLHLDLGQRDFAVATCLTCGMLYGKGLPEEERLHDQFHNAHANAFKFSGWVSERVVLRDGTGSCGGRLLCVLPNDPKPQLRKVVEISGRLESVLGVPQGYLLASKPPYKVFMWASGSGGGAGGGAGSSGGSGGRGRIVGVLVAQLQQRARWCKLAPVEPPPRQLKERIRSSSYAVSTTAATKGPTDATSPTGAARGPPAAPLPGGATAIEREGSLDTDCQEGVKIAAGCETAAAAAAATTPMTPNTTIIPAHSSAPGTSTGRKARASERCGAAAVVETEVKRPRLGGGAVTRVSTVGEVPDSCGGAGRTVGRPIAEVGVDCGATAAQERRSANADRVGLPCGDAPQAVPATTTATAVPADGLAPATPCYTVSGAAGGGGGGGCSSGDGYAKAAAKGAQASPAASSQAAVAAHEVTRTCASAAEAAAVAAVVALPHHRACVGDGGSGGEARVGELARVVIGVRGLWVEPGWRRRGVARRLLDAARCCMVPGVAADRTGVSFSACAVAAVSGDNDGGGAFAAFAAAYLGSGGSGGAASAACNVLLYDDDNEE